MLEYDEKTYQENYSPFGQGYAIGVAESIVGIKFRKVRRLTKKYTDNQLRGLEPIEGDKDKPLIFKNASEVSDFLDLYRKYENYDEKRFFKRYIAESEYLPWSLELQGL